MKMRKVGRVEGWEEGYMWIAERVGGGIYVDCWKGI